MSGHHVRATITLRNGRCILAQLLGTAANGTLPTHKSAKQLVGSMANIPIHATTA